MKFLLLTAMKYDHFSQMVNWAPPKYINFYQNRIGMCRLMGTNVSVLRGKLKRGRECKNLLLIWSDCDNEWNNNGPLHKMMARYNARNERAGGRAKQTKYIVQVSIKINCYNQLARRQKVSRVIKYSPHLW